MCAGYAETTDFTELLIATGAEPNPVCAIASIAPNTRLRWVLLFTLRTHREVFSGAEHADAGEAPWPIGLALATLTGVTVLVALVSEIFVESVQKAAETFG